MTQLRTPAQPLRGDGDHHGLGVGQAGCALRVAHVRSRTPGPAGLPDPVGRVHVPALGEPSQQSSQAPCALTEPGHRRGRQAAQGKPGARATVHGGSALPEC